MENRLSSRVIFIDLMRFVAIASMIQGHCVDAFLDFHYKIPNSVGFGTWLFFRGLTAPFFLFCSGFIYGLRFSRAESDEKFREISFKTIKRAFLLICVGYLMKSPTTSPFHLGHINNALLQIFLAIDILQLIGISLLILLLVETISRKFSFNNTEAIVLTALSFTVLTPIITMIDWERFFPLMISSWVSTRTGSLFPLFPWGAYLLLGSAIGIYFKRENILDSSINTTKSLLKLGLIFVVLASAFNWIETWVYGNSTFWTTSPNLVFVRFGCVLIFGSLLSALSVYVKSIPQFLYNASRNSLPIYVGHVMLLYGSAWNVGLKDFYGFKLNVIETIIAASLVTFFMFIFSEIVTILKKEVPLIIDEMKLNFELTKNSAF
ncbi:MAG: DUF1624 domain-containing protein [Ignavibacteria bacterium]|nr:DUF1624 domain-containing protein [Ignavibacteria bacterium]